MKQQINLCNALPRERQLYLPWRKMVLYTVLFLIVLLAIFFMMLWKNVALNISVAKITAKEKQAIRMVTVVSKKYPKEMKNAELEQKVAALRTDIAEEQVLLKLLKGRKTTNTTGFLPYLQTLSSHLVPGVWLTKIDITDGGAYIQLEGQGYTSAQILDYVYAINNTPLFTEDPLRVQRMAKAEQPKQPMTFVLKAKREDADVS